MRRIDKALVDLCRHGEVSFREYNGDQLIVEFTTPQDRDGKRRASNVMVSVLDIDRSRIDVVGDVLNEWRVQEVWREPT